ncbi:MAG: TIGR03013 family PEP-CTERM/XrtA system glycosyltransferase [Comamonadaceae bacterium]|nr:TIGR03013 family PEP-CTERM/XrtA system glycosyltransferase [Pseudomonadota bacterium]MBS0611526.1 TIGR03013 family PEP-CTERM/XrtA system glycosyltransferase [Pseudomonadota bacterium]MDE2415179.1 TIGR03013 family PEP-CTERM/XrtA system glycosyltransferase [Comamonadaceae bacterium]
MLKIFNHYFRRGTILQIIMYTMLIVGTLIISLMLQGGVGGFNGALISSGFVRGGLMAIGIVGVNFALGLYDRPSKLTVGQVRARAVLSFILSMAIAGCILLFMPLHPPYQNEETLLALLLIVGGMLIMRLLGNEILPASYARQRVLVYGTGVRASIVGKSLQENDPGIELIGYFRGLQEKEPAISGLNVVSPGKTLTEVVREQNVNEIVVALSERRGGSMPMRELLDCKLQGIHVIDLATHFEQLLGQVHLEAVSAGWLIFGDGFKQGFVRSLVKRLLDVVGSAVLLLLAAPIMLLTAILIFIESGRPIFYRQERVGLNGGVFNVIKFRSMRQDAEKDGTPRWAGAGDTRVTRVGKIIRKMRIDELPQLFCVLKGDMSLVGPRPERPYFVERLTQDIPYYALRHGIKPGLTGWAQVRYHYGASIKDAEQKLQYDLYYVKNHSWLLDLIILFETVGVVLTGKGAQ